MKDKFIINPSLIIFRAGRIDIRHKKVIYSIVQIRAIFKYGECQNNGNVYIQIKATQISSEGRSILAFPNNRL